MHGVEQEMGFLIKMWIHLDFFSSLGLRSKFLLF